MPSSYVSQLTDVGLTLQTGQMVDTPQQQIVRSEGRCVFAGLQVVVNFELTIKERDCGLTDCVYYLNGIPTRYGRYCGID